MKNCYNVAIRQHCVINNHKEKEKKREYKEKLYTNDQIEIQNNNDQDNMIKKI